MEHFQLATHNGYITIQNTLRGTHRTFRIKRQKDSASFLPGQRILGILTGPNNIDDYMQIGTVGDNGEIRLWRKHDTLHFRKLIDVLQHRDKWAALGVKYLIDGRCYRCNRTLTTPQSISNGIGPECAKR